MTQQQLVDALTHAMRVFETFTDVTEDELSLVKVAARHEANRIADILSQLTGRSE